GMARRPVRARCGARIGNAPGRRGDHDRRRRYHEDRPGAPDAARAGVTDAVETGPGGRRPRVTVKLLLTGLGALVVLAAPLWAPLFLRRLDFFRLRRLEIVGTRYIATGEIVARAQLDTTRSVWDPTAPIATRVQSHPGVQLVSIRRKLPG